MGFDTMFDYYGDEDERYVECPHELPKGMYEIKCETDKAILLKNTRTGGVAWVPKSLFNEEVWDGEVVYLVDGWFEFNWIEDEHNQTTPTEIEGDFDGF